ncbi:MAG: YbhB/YbcL family Raf kinase inhibitor-like protein [Candidatus Omnitrophica bacterium]|nr:YbhB/YbcL family Raf kinase inhibitor-like protein [Candidatus Omnitrophota bacterium]
MTVESSAFDDGEAMPDKYSLSDDNVSPPISWSDVPSNTKSVAVICEDPDAPSGLWVHWVVFNIPSDISALPEDLPDEGVLAGGIIQGVNDFGRIGWDGPAPPEGVHRYIFRVYGLDSMLGLGPGASRKELLSAMDGHIIARGSMTGTYEK